MTFTQFEEAVTQDHVTDVVINQNKAVPTGVVTLTLEDGETSGRVNVSDVNEVQKLLDKHDIDYQIGDIPKDSLFATTVLPVILMLVGFYVYHHVNEPSGRRSQCQSDEFSARAAPV